MKGDVLLQNIKVSGLVPVTVGKKAKEVKLSIREVILTKLGKNIDNVRKRCSGKQLSITVAFFLHDTTHSKRDLEGLANTVIKILGEEMSSKKEDMKGLSIVTNTNLICRIILEKNIVKKDVPEEFSFSIYDWN